MAELSLINLPVALALRSNRGMDEDGGQVSDSIPPQSFGAYASPGREFRDKIEQWLAWTQVKSETRNGTLEGEFDHFELADSPTDRTHYLFPRTLRKLSNLSIAASI